MSAPKEGACPKEFRERVVKMAQMGDQRRSDGTLNLENSTDSVWRGVMSAATAQPAGS